MTAGSRTCPSSIVKNTTGLGVGTREMIGATEPPWIATGVGGIVVVVVVVDVDVVVDLVAIRRRCDLAACTVCPPDVIAPTSTQALATPTAVMASTAATANRRRLDAASRRIRRAIRHALSSRNASGGCLCRRFRHMHHGEPNHRGS